MSMTTGSANYDKFDELAEEFAARFRRGERPSLQEYIDRYPELADPIRELFPALVEVERADVEQQVERKNAPAAATDAPPPLSQVGDYRVLREVGRGGMGVVYEAEQVSLGRRVALKVLPRRVSPDNQMLARFRREARSAAQLHHTNIVPVFEVGKDGDVSYYAMQFIQGQGLDVVIDELRRLKEHSRPVTPAPKAETAPPGSPSTAAGMEADPAPTGQLTQMAQSLLTGRFAAGPLGGLGLATSASEEPKADATMADPLDPAVTGATQAGATQASEAGARAVAGPTSSMVLPGGSQLSTVEPGHRSFFRSVAHIGRQVAAGLGYAHRRGIVHRDIKPSNLLLDTEGVVWISDFGLAKAGDDGLSQTGDILGTLRYMAPERFRGAGDARADTYALGLTLYELLTLRPAYDSSDRLKLIGEIKTEDPPRPRAIDARIPRDLETIVLKAIEKDPDRRYRSADALAEDLRRFLDDEPIRARRTSASERVWRWCRRKPFDAVLVGTTAALLVVLAVGSTVAAVLINAERIRADAKAMGELAARKTAERTAEESRSRLVRLYINTGTSSAERGDVGPALLWYDRAWEADRTDPRREPSHRQRLAAIIDRGPQLVGLCAHASPVLNAQFDPACRRVLTRTDEPQAYLWDPFRATLATNPLRHDDRVLHAEFSPDGARVVTSSADRTARLWDSSTGARLGPPLIHPDVVHWAAFSPDGRTLATACADGQVRIWDLPSSTPRDRTIACPAPALCVVFHPDGARLLTADGGGHARLWEASTAVELIPPIPHHMAPGNPFDRLELPPAFSRDGRRVLAAHDQTVSLWDLHEPTLNQRVNQRVMNFSINRVEFDAAGSRVLVVGRATDVSVLDAAAEGLPTLGTIAHTREVQQGGFHPDGGRIVTFSSTGVIHVWDRKDGRKRILPFRYFDGITQRIQFSPNGRLLLAASLDGSARVWQIDGRSFAPRKYHLDCGRADMLSPIPFGPSQRAAFSPDGRSVVVIADSGPARIMTSDEPSAAGVALDLGEPIHFVKFSGDGRRVLTAGISGARVWEAGSGRPVGTPILLDHPFLVTKTMGEPGWYVPGPPISVQLSQSGQRLAAIDDATNVRVYDVQTGSVLLGPITPLSVKEPSPDLLESAERVPSSRRLVGCLLSADGRWLAVAIDFGRGGAVYLYHIDTGRLLGIPSRYGYLACLNFSEDGRRLLIGSTDATVRTWDTDTGLPIGPSLRHHTVVGLAAFSPEGRRIAVCDVDGMLSVWDCESGDLLVPSFPVGVSPIRWIWFSRDGRSIVGQSWSGEVSRWDLPGLTGSRAQVADLVHLLTASEIDATDGIERLPRQTLRNDPERFRHAWLACRSAIDADSTARPPSGSRERSWFLSRMESERLRIQALPHNRRGPQ